MMFWGGTSARQHLLILNKSLQPNCTTIIQDVNPQWENKTWHICIFKPCDSISCILSVYASRGTAVLLSLLFIIDDKKVFSIRVWMYRQPVNTTNSYWDRRNPADSSSSAPSQADSTPSRFCGQHGEVSADTSSLWIRLILKLPSSLSPGLRTGG